MAKRILLKTLLGIVFIITISATTCSAKSSLTLYSSECQIATDKTLTNGDIRIKRGGTVDDATPTVNRFNAVAWPLLR